MKRAAILTCAVLIGTAGVSLAARSLAAQSLPETVEAIEQARVITRILYVTAHPDDEPAGLLTYLARGLHADVALCSITRGEGGQNALGPEQGEQLGILRTAELEAATHIYGVKLFFTRAPDFGYSKTAEETLQVWGDRAPGDLVRVIRTFRPDVIINHWGGVRSGHGNHQAAGMVTARAYEAAADAKAFPEQLAEGLAPWHARLLLQLARGEAAGAWRVPSGDISPLWGKSYNEISREGFANHRTQGIPAFLSSPFLRRAIALVRPDGGSFDPKQLAEPLVFLAQQFPADGALLRPGLEEADRALARARQAALELDWAGAERALAEAGRQSMHLEALLGTLPAQSSRGAQSELSRVRERIDRALALAAAIRIETQANRSELVAGEIFSVRVDVRDRHEMLSEIDKPSLILPPGWNVTKEETDQSGTLRFAVTIPKDAKIPHTPDAWMYPWPRPLVSARVRAVVEGYAFETQASVESQRATSTRIYTLPLSLAPAVTLTLEPRQFLVVEKRPPKQLELLARVHYFGSSAAKVAVGVEAPAGWRVATSGPLEFSAPGDQLVRFEVTPPAHVPPGDYAFNAWARTDSEKFQTSLEPLASLPTRVWREPAVATVHAFDVTVPPGLRIGYVAAENDPIPAALHQLGVRVELLDPVGLAFSDLHRFDAIAIGIRAYELREDLARNNSRLLEYCAAGGTLVVQYEREGVWNALKPAPYPATIGQPTVRITDENSPVRFLASDGPVLNYPNRITQEDFKGWVQERGLYFWSQWDARYQPILGLRDPGEPEVSGGLLSARYGKGVYIYTGLAFFRQLPEGVTGAYRLFINLLSQSKAVAKTP